MLRVRTRQLYFVDNILKIIALSFLKQEAKCIARAVLLSARRISKTKKTKGGKFQCPLDGQIFETKATKSPKID